MSDKVAEAPDSSDSKKPEKSAKYKLLMSRKVLAVLVAVLAVILLVPSGYLAYVYTSSPDSIRNPFFDHYHFRMQVIVDGKSENFVSDKYQQEYAKDLCTAELTDSPIHFHDQKDQFTHIHWNGMTGGLVMKQYGWNFIGGSDSVLGYRMDNLPMPKKVPIRGKLLPQVPDGSNYYVYIGDENNYSEKSFEDWKKQDLEQFFGKSSNLPGNEGASSSFIETLFFPNTFAHGGVDD